MFSYLTLVAFSPAFTGDGGVFAPAFPAVYGGYYIGFGSIYNAADLCVSYCIALCSKLIILLNHHQL